MSKTKFIQFLRDLRKNGVKNCNAKQDQSAFEVHASRIEKKSVKPQKNKWELLPVHDEDPKIKIVKESAKRLKNWIEPLVVSERENHLKIRTVDNGTYSFRSTYRFYQYRPMICAAYRLFPLQNKIAIRLYKLPLIILKAPRGWEFVTDEYGLCIRMKNNPDCNYHPFADEFQSKKISEFCQIARENYQKIKKAKKIEKLIPDDQVIVSIRDARKAGNCLVGIKNFMRVHNITKKAISAVILRRIKSSQYYRIEATITTAKIRLAESLDNGFSPLYPI